VKVIKYKLCTRVNHGTDEVPELEEILFPVEMEWNEKNEETANREAYNGEYTIEDNGVSEFAQPTQLDRIEAQVAYTAMITDTLLEA
jgi:hypothetical protein